MMIILKKVFHCLSSIFVVLFFRFNSVLSTVSPFRDGTHTIVTLTMPGAHRKHSFQDFLENLEEMFPRYF